MESQVNQVVNETNANGRQMEQKCDDPGKAMNIKEKSSDSVGRESSASLSRSINVLAPEL